MNAANAALIMQQGGVTELHASARRKVGSAMHYRVGGVSMGAPDSDEYVRLTTSADEVRDIVNAINNYK